jgi:hypothetical protein
MQALFPSGHLEIHQAKNEEVYRDIVRIPENARLDSAGKKIDEGRICKIKSGSKTAYVIVRGVKNFDPQGSPEHVHDRCIHMDDATRARLGVNGKPSARFDLKPVGFTGQLIWAWNATEIGYRVSSRLGLIGLALGLIALFPELIKWTQELTLWVQQNSLGKKP